MTGAAGSTAILLLFCYCSIGISASRGYTLVLLPWSVTKLNAVNRELFTALSLQTYFDRHCLYCNYFFLPLYSSDTVNLARPFARRAAKTRRPFFVAILSRKPCLFFLFLLEGWNVLFITIFVLCYYSIAVSGCKNRYFF